MQENMAKLVDQALEKTCFLKYTDADDLGMMHCFLNMFRIRKAIEFMDGEQGYERYAIYLNKKQDKKAILKEIGFVKSICAIKD